MTAQEKAEFLKQYRYAVWEHSLALRMYNQCKRAVEKAGTGPWVDVWTQHMTEWEFRAKAAHARCKRMLEEAGYPL